MNSGSDGLRRGKWVNVSFWQFSGKLLSYHRVNSSKRRSSFLAHSSDINDLLEGLDGVLEDWLNRLHDSESSLHVVDLWLHALDGLHLSGDLNEGLSVIESLEDSSGKSLLDVLDSGGLGNSGISVSTGLELLGLGELGLKRDEELVLIHGLVSLHSLEELGLVVSMVVVSGSSGGDQGEFH